MLSAIWRAIVWCFHNFDSLLVLVVAATCAVLHLLHVIDLEVVAGVTLAVLALVGFSLLHDRVARGHLGSQLQSMSTAIESLRGSLETPRADAFFTTSTNEKPLLEGAEQEVWAVQETGSLLVESNKNQLIGLLKGGRHVRMVVSAPTPAIARLMAFRNANLTFDAILNRAKLLESHIADVISQTGADAQSLEVRYVPYPIDMTCVVVDPRHPTPARRRGIVRQAGFRVTYADKLDFAFNASTSPLAFSHYFKEAGRVFEHAAKVVLVTGAPRCGKTRLLEGLIDRFRGEKELFYVISPAISDRNKRLGFNVRTTDNPEPIPFAKRTGNEEEYQLVPEVWPRIVDSLGNARSSGRIMILDEIGRLQLKEPALGDFLESTMQDVCATLFASIASDDDAHPLVRKLKRHHRTTVLELTKHNAEEIEAILLRELQSALQVARTMPRHCWE